MKFNGYSHIFGTHIVTYSNIPNYQHIEEMSISAEIDSLCLLQCFEMHYVVICLDPLRKGP